MAVTITYPPISTEHDASGFEPVVLFPTRAGAPRMRKDIDERSAVIRLSWVLNSAQFNGMSYAYRTQRASTWNVTFMHPDDGYGSYACTLIPGSFVWRAQNAEYFVQAAFNVNGVAT